MSTNNVLDFGKNTTDSCIWEQAGKTKMHSPVPTAQDSEDRELLETLNELLYDGGLTM